MTKIFETGNLSTWTQLLCYPPPTPQGRRATPEKKDLRK